MLDLYANLALGFGTVWKTLWLPSVATGLPFAVPIPINLILCFVGCLIGTLVGVLPGVGPIATIAMLMPLTYGLEPLGGLIMLAGIYYGAQYGGSTTAILVNIPGEATSVVTTLDGHPMARQGRAGVALGIAAIGSFVAGCIATVIIAGLAAPLTRFALAFGPAEYFSLMILGLILTVILARGSLFKAIAMILVGVLLATVGSDFETGQDRLTFGIDYFKEGFDFAVVAMGIFGFAEMIRTLEQPETRVVIQGAIGRLLPGRADLRRSAAPIARGTLIGSILGLLPGNGAILGPFAAYAAEKRLAADPQRFGHGAIEGVAGPEAANNAGAQTAFVPLLTLGIPPNGVMALMVGAMAVHGITPGPQIMTTKPDLFWGLIVSMWIGNVMLLIINLPLIGLWVRLLKVPYRLLFPAIVLFCCIGIYCVQNSTVDVLLVAAFGLFGYVILKLGFEPTPLLLGFVLGRLMEEKVRTALRYSRGSVMTFLESPLSAAFLVLAVVVLLIAVLPMVRAQRNTVFGR